MNFYFQNTLRRREAMARGDSPERSHMLATLRHHFYGVDDALLLAGVAASAAGTGMGVAGNAEAQSKMNQVRTAEVKRESDLQDQANSVFQKRLSTAGADTAKKQVDTGAAQRQSVYNALKQSTDPTVGTPLPADNPNPVVDDATSSANTIAAKRGNAWTTLGSEAASKEGGYQDQATDQAVSNADANRRLGVIGNEASGWARVFPTELEVAGHAGDALSGWGQLVSALGSAAGMAGGMGIGVAKAAGTSMAGTPVTTVNDLGPAVSDINSPWATLNLPPDMR